MLPRATLCGVSHADGSVTLAPDDAYVIRADDEVVLLAESSSVDITPADESAVPSERLERYYMKALSEYTDADPWAQEDSLRRVQRRDVTGGETGARHGAERVGDHHPRGANPGG